MSPKRLTLCLLVTVVLNACVTDPETRGSKDEVRILGGDSYLQFADLTLAGKELSAWEGKTVEVRLGYLFDGEREGFARTRVQGGGFSLDFTQVREVGVYKSIAWYFDVDQDGKCTVGVDQGYAGATGGSEGRYTLEVVDWMILPADKPLCAIFDGPWPD